MVDPALSQQMIQGGTTIDGFEEMPQPGWFLDSISKAPTITATVGNVAFRGSNTIISGGWADRSPRNLNPGDPNLRGAFKNNNPFRPRNWTRFGSSSIYTGNPAQTYTPFYAGQILNRGVNFARKSQRINNAFNKMNIPDAPFGKGSYSRISAASRVGMMSDRAFQRAAPHLTNFMKGAGLGVVADTAAGAGQAATRTAILGTTPGLTGRAAGFLAGAHEYKAAQVSGRAMASAPSYFQADPRRGYQFAQKAATKAAAGSGTAKAGLAAARGVGAAIPGVNVAAAAWFAYDMGRLGSSLLGHATKGTAGLAIDAVDSYAGDLRGGVMKSSFTDNEVTMTSRRRGVEAIQNSRLNMRSILGAEGGMMGAHFG